MAGEVDYKLKSKGADGSIIYPSVPFIRVGLTPLILIVVYTAAFA